jgi:hypothetical protein
VEYALAETLASRGDVLGTLRDPAQADTAYREALGIATGLTDSHPDVGRYAALLARIQRPLGDLEMSQGRVDEALTRYEAALAIELKLARMAGSSSERLRLIALTRLRTADGRARRGQWRDALVQYSEAIETLRSMQAGSTTATLTRDTAVGLTRLAEIVQVSDHSAAAAQMREAIALFRELAASDAADARVRRDLYLALVQYGDLLLQVDAEGARGQYLEALKLAEGARATSAPGDESDREILLIRNRLSAGPAAVAPSLRLSAVVRGERVLLGPGDPVPLGARGLVADAKGPPGWLRYVVLFGAEGDATILDERQLDKAQWTLPLAGPPPAQTILLLTVPRPLTDGERQTLTSELSAVPGPRAIDWDSRVVWTSEEREPRIVSTASARGSVDTGWIRMVRARLSSIPAARFAGQTFPIAAPGS